MVCAAHRPCYLPSLSFFYKMCLADVFVIADEIQYSKHSLINRARIKTATGVNWLTVPVWTKGRKKQLINQVQIDGQQNWQRKHWKSLLVNYKYAAYFEKYANFFEKLYRHQWRSLLALNLEIINYLRERLNISTELRLISQLNVTGEGTDRLTRLLEKLGCQEYLCELELKNHLDPQKFQARRMALSFFSPVCPHYHQLFGSFVPGLSTIDLLFNEGENSHNLILHSE